MPGDIPKRSLWAQVGQGVEIGNREAIAKMGKIELGLELKNLAFFVRA